MKKRGIVPATLGQVKDIGAALIQAIPPTLGKEAAQRIISSKGALIKAIERAFQEISGHIDLLTEWSSFYGEVFGLNCFTSDFECLEIPTRPYGFGWLIIMREGLTAQSLLAKCQERFACEDESHDKLDTLKSVRIADRRYALWVRDCIEADEENKDKSAKDCEHEGMKGITLEERLILELFYHWKTDNHLDIEDHSTLCTGSYYSNCYVPRVKFSNGRVCILSEYPKNGSLSIRVREVSL